MYNIIMVDLIEGYYSALKTDENEQAVLGGSVSKRRGGFGGLVAKGLMTHIYD